MTQTQILKYPATRIQFCALAGLDGSAELKEYSFGLEANSSLLSVNLRWSGEGIYATVTKRYGEPSNNDLARVDREIKERLKKVKV